jgi:2-keto-4-pentenoate hydratase/2-oxohepta-3-ene-1,7-dioic acid hydratase in catechol pathway
MGISGDELMIAYVEILDGDIVTVEIEKLGSLTNRLVTEEV